MFSRFCYRSFFFGLGVFLLQSNGCLLGQVPHKRSEAPKQNTFQISDEDLVSVDFPEPVELKELFKKLAYWTKKNILIDTKDPGKIQILAPKKVSKAEAYQIFLSAADALGYSVIETRQIVRLQQKKDASKGWGPQVIENHEVHYTDRLYTQIFRLKFISPDKLRDALSRLVSTSIVTVPATNSIILTDTGFNLRKIADFISVADQTEFESAYEIVHLKHTFATETSKLLTDLFSAEEKVGGQALKIIVDERNNSLILAGPEYRMKRARDLITQLDIASDIPRQEDNSHIYVWPMNFADAKKQASVLMSLGPGNNAQSTESRSKDLQIVADETTNSLLIKGSASAFKSMKGLIRRLDQERPQVFLKMNILSVSKNNNFDFLPALLAGVAKSDGTGTKTIVGYNTVAMAPLILAQANLSAGGSSVAATSAGQVASAFSNDLHVGTFPGGSLVLPGVGTISPGALISIMKTDKATRLLSSPEILTMDNEEASFTVGDTYVYKSSKPDDFGNITQNIQKENADLTVKIKPSMSGSEYLNLQVEVDSNSIQGFSEDGIPEIVKRKARQLVNIKNNQTVLISGIQNLYRSSVEKRVPVIGSIPVIGYLFSSTEIRNAMSYTMIFITAHVVRSAEDLQALYKESHTEELLNHGRGIND